MLTIIGAPDGIREDLFPIGKSKYLKILNGQAIYSKCPEIGQNHIAYWFQLPSNIVGITFLDKTSLEVTRSFTMPELSHLLKFCPIYFPILCEIILIHYTIDE
jgi:hypothetical protein